jgi:hypothetical protein
MKKLYASFVFALLCSFSALAQLTPLQGYGPAPVVNGNVYTLTRSDVYYGGQANAVWEQTQISLANAFTVCVRLNFGVFSEANPDPNNPNGTSLSGLPFSTGADGIAFVLAPQPYVGQTGEEIGYGTRRIDNPGGGFPYEPNVSFAVEFDTWQNIAGNGAWDLNDPVQDHMAFMRSGYTVHGGINSGTPPVLLGDIEDGNWYNVTITWNPATGMTVNFNGTTMTTSAADVIASLGGNTAAMVNWGFTAATGMGTNEQKVEFISCPPPPPPADCGQLRTQTMGGWGQKPAGNNPGSYLQSHFAAAFPTGVRVGTTTGYSAVWTSAAAVRNFLPSGGPSIKLTANYTNPTSAQLKSNVIGQLLALSISVGLDAHHADYAPSGVVLGDMIIASGPFAGWTVYNFLAEANVVVSGGTSMYTVQQVQATAAAINENYVDGKMDGGYLNCPGTQLRVMPSTTLNENISSFLASVYPNPNRGAMQIKMNTEATDRSEVQIINSRGEVVERRLVTGNAPQVNFNLKKYGTGVFIVKIISGNNIETKKVLVQD